MGIAGVGMDKETLSRIFGPFYTTKEKGKGTGLGLSTVYGIIKQSGGHILATSEPGVGSRFKIYLPQIEEAIEPTPASRTPTLSLQGSETVLLVEDEAALRNLTTRILKNYGYAVLSAEHGGEALKICEQQEGRIDLLLTDVIMPKMNGRDLAERIKSLRPDIKVLYISGYTEDNIAHHGILDMGINFLNKPFTPIGLAQKIRDTLDRAA
jgi:CheY-like chemotaxis protein